MHNVLATLSALPIFVVMYLSIKLGLLYKDEFKLEWVQSRWGRITLRSWLLLISPVTLTLFVVSDAYDASWPIAYRSFWAAKRGGAAFMRHVFPS